MTQVSAATIAGRSCLDFLCVALACLLITPGPARATRFLQRCTLDTSKVESAIESPELSALNERVKRAFNTLQAKSHGLDERSHRFGFRAMWLCEVERTCGQFASMQTGMRRCLEDALRLRALDLEGQLKARSD